MRRAQSINMPMSRLAGVLATTGGGTQSGAAASNDCVLLFGNSSGSGGGIAAVDDAQLGTGISVVRPGLYHCWMACELGAGATAQIGLTLNGDAASLNSDPSFANAGTIATLTATAPAATGIPMSISTVVAIDRVLAGAVGGAILRWVGSDGSDGAPAGLILATMQYRITKIAELFV